MTVTSIRFRLFMLMSLFAGTTLALAYASHMDFSEYRRQRAQLDLSYLARDLAQELSVSPSKERGAADGRERETKDKARQEIVHRLQSLKPRLLPERRAKEVGDLVQSLGEGGNVRMARERIQVFIKNESEFERFTREQLDYLEKRLVYLAALALLTLALGFFGLQFFVSRVIIRPMHDLSRKMTDFLHDRYTYQFSVSSSDELGHMQATFNSLAQRVIANMEQLKTLDQAKSEFLSIASHELRTPLTSIKGSLSLMRSGVVGKMNEMAENLLSIAETETDRLIRLINDILDLAKIEAQKLPLHQDWTSLNKLVETCINSLQGLAGQADVQLVAEAIPPIEAYMDNDRMQQVLTNLLSNAIKFSPKGAPVVVRVNVDQAAGGQGEGRGHALVIEVCDRGRGIDPQDQEAIFQKFRQASNAKNPLVKGTGLGLAIARALVEQHGGEIGVRSVVGQGSTFYYTLPEWRYSRAAIKSEAAA